MFTRVSVIIFPLSLNKDSPVTLGLSTDTNQLNVEGTFALKNSLTAFPLHTSILSWFVNSTSGCTLTVTKESGPRQPKGKDFGVTV